MKRHPSNSDWSTSTHAESSNDGYFEPIHILLVEDSQADIDLTLEMMKICKVSNNVTAVKDGEEALQYLRRQGKYAQCPRPSLILLDLNLPKKDGRQVLAEIRQDPELTQLPVVIFSTSEDERDVTAAYRNYANCFITKPADTEQFIKIVEAIDTFWLQIVELPTQGAPL